MKRAIVIVMDGCGAGEAPDAAEFNDLDHPATLKHVWEKVGPLKTPTLAALGLWAAVGVDAGPVGLPNKGVRYGRMRELSMGKDSVTGHWEMMGIVTKTPFPTYPKGFPLPFVKSIEREIGLQFLGNKAASGTQIINELGEMHLMTGSPILYTSADSVLQIAAHEEEIPLPKLYEICQIARRLAVEPNNVQRVIARPFRGDAAHGFERTENRKDFPLPAPPNLIDKIGDVFGVGVIPELFGGRGFRSVRRTQNNAEHAVMLEEALKSDARFIFANFEDFDMKYGHRNDVPGFGKALEDFDRVVGDILEKLTGEDLFMITADHGNDPSSESTDHSREYVPICAVGSLHGASNLQDLSGMNHLGAAVAQHLDVKMEGLPTSPF